MKQQKRTVYRSVRFLKIHQIIYSKMEESAAYFLAQLFPQES